MPSNQKHIANGWICSVWKEPMKSSQRRNAEPSTSCTSNNISQLSTQMDSIHLRPASQARIWGQDLRPASGHWRVKEFGKALTLWKIKRHSSLFYNVEFQASDLIWTLWESWKWKADTGPICVFHNQNSPTIFDYFNPLRPERSTPELQNKRSETPEQRQPFLLSTVSLVLSVLVERILNLTVGAGQKWICHKTITKLDLFIWCTSSEMEDWWAKEKTRWTEGREVESEDGWMDGCGRRWKLKPLS